MLSQRENHLLAALFCILVQLPLTVYVTTANNAENDATKVANDAKDEATKAAEDQAAEKEAAKRAEELYIAALADEIRQLLCKILPTDLLLELKNAKNDTVLQANAFARHIQKGDPFYATNHFMPSPLACLYLNSKSVFDEIECDTPAEFTRILSGLGKIYAHEVAQQHTKLQQKLRRLCADNYRDTDIIQYYIDEVFNVIDLSQKDNSLIDQQVLASTILSQNNVNFDLRELQTSILRIIPENLYTDIVYARNGTLTNEEHWKKYWLQCFLRNKIAPTNFVMAKLYFSPADLQALLSSTKLAMQTMVELLTDLMTIRQYAATITNIYWKKILLHAETKTLNNWKNASKAKVVVAELYKKLADLNGAIMPLPKVDDPPGKAG